MSSCGRFLRFPSIWRWLPVCQAGAAAALSMLCISAGTQCASGCLRDRHSECASFVYDSLYPKSVGVVELACHCPAGSGNACCLFFLCTCVGAPFCVAIPCTCTCRVCMWHHSCAGCIFHTSSNAWRLLLAGMPPTMLHNSMCFVRCVVPSFPHCVRSCVCTPPHTFCILCIRVMVAVCAC